jgi:hypothetical protein
MVDTSFLTFQIYPSPWSAVKATYIFCRYYPLATAPFHIWGLVGDHDLSVCESNFHALYATAIPTMVSAQCKHELEYVLSRLLITLLFSMSSVILMLRTYAFSGVKKWILAVLSIVLLGFVGVTIWVTIKQLARLSR